MSPLLEWELTRATSEPNPEAPPVCYDVAIHQAGHEPGGFFKHERRWVGEQLYYRERIAQTSHRVEIPLARSRDYYWFVRAREGERVGPWSSYGYFLFLGAGYMYGKNLPYGFRTPD